MENFLTQKYKMQNRCNRCSFRLKCVRSKVRHFSSQDYCANVIHLRMTSLVVDRCNYMTLACMPFDERWTCAMVNFRWHFYSGHSPIAHEMANKLAESCSLARFRWPIDCGCQPMLGNCECWFLRSIHDIIADHRVEYCFRQTDFHYNNLTHRTLLMTKSREKKRNKGKKWIVNKTHPSN